MVGSSALNKISQVNSKSWSDDDRFRFIEELNVGGMDGYREQSSSKGDDLALFVANVRAG